MNLKHLESSQTLQPPLIMLLKSRLLVLIAYTIVWTPENLPRAASRVGKVRACQCTKVHKNKQMEGTQTLFIFIKKYKLRSPSTCVRSMACWRLSNLGNVVFMIPGASEGFQLITPASQAHIVPLIKLLWSSSSIFASRLHAWYWCRCRWRWRKGLIDP
jgi:hypothetical protein